MARNTPDNRRSERNESHVQMAKPCHRNAAQEHEDHHWYVIPLQVRERFVANGFLQASDYCRHNCHPSLLRSVPEVKPIRVSHTIVNEHPGNRDAMLECSDWVY